LLLQMVALI